MRPRQSGRSIPGPWVCESQAVHRWHSSGLSRVVALPGPQVEKPRLRATRLGANLAELDCGELKPVAIALSPSCWCRNAQARVGYSDASIRRVGAGLRGSRAAECALLRCRVDKHSVLTFCSKAEAEQAVQFTTTYPMASRGMVPLELSMSFPLDILPHATLRYLIVAHRRCPELGCLS